jgi:hypothetical protein
MFAKIFDQIFDSSIAEDHMVRHVFMDLLVLADRDGVVDKTLEAISRRTNVPLSVVAHAMKQLADPDRRSRSHLEDGARITLLDSRRDWGWQIVNYEHYRNLHDEESRKAYFRDKKREYRSRPKDVQIVQDIPKMSTQAEAEADVYVNTPPTPPQAGGQNSPLRAVSRRRIRPEALVGIGPQRVHTPEEKESEEILGNWLQARERWLNYLEWLKKPPKTRKPKIWPEDKIPNDPGEKPKFTKESAS